jgi:hypothetical protein
VDHDNHNVNFEALLDVISQALHIGTTYLLICELRYVPIVPQHTLQIKKGSANS